MQQRRDQRRDEPRRDDRRRDEPRPRTTGAGRSRGAQRRLRPGRSDDGVDDRAEVRPAASGGAIDLTDEPPTFRRADRRPYAPPRDPWN
ncbi:hypothetical protein JL721_12762 [Aureococcus anophagefferens]|nr:hypothetical protein JL721_12762 [Aureococcus anophagefferens]